LGTKNCTVRSSRIFSRSTIKVNKLGGLGWGEEFGEHGDMRDSYRILVGVPKTNRPLGRQAWAGR